MHKFEFLPRSMEESSWHIASCWSRTSSLAKIADESAAASSVWFSARLLGGRSKEKESQGTVNRTGGLQPGGNARYVPALMSGADSTAALAYPVAVKSMPGPPVTSTSGSSTGVSAEEFCVASISWKSPEVSRLSKPACRLVVGVAGACVASASWLPNRNPGVAGEAVGPLCNSTVVLSGVVS